MPQIATLRSVFRATAPKLLIAVFLIAGLAASQGTALAAPTTTSAHTSAASHARALGQNLCYGKTCDNTDPYLMHCNTGSYYVLAEAPLYSIPGNTASYSYGYIQLWWSDTCQTNWIRGWVACLDLCEQNNYWDMQTQGGSPPLVQSSGGPRYDWTNQWYGPSNVQACGTVQIDIGQPSELAYEAEVGQAGYNCSYRQ